MRRSGRRPAPSPSAVDGPGAVGPFPGVDRWDVANGWRSPPTLRAELCRGGHDRRRDVRSRRRLANLRVRSGAPWRSASGPSRWSALVAVGRHAANSVSPEAGGERPPSPASTSRSTPGNESNRSRPSTAPASAGGDLTRGRSAGGSQPSRTASAAMNPSAAATVSVGRHRGPPAPRVDAHPSGRADVPGAASGAPAKASAQLVHGEPGT